jgi:hypothetical protein
LRYQPRQSPALSPATSKTICCHGWKANRIRISLRPSRSRPQLLHILDLGRGDLTDEWALQARSVLLEQLDGGADLAGGVSVELPQTAGPVGELGCDFHYPCHELSIAQARDLGQTKQPAALERRIMPGHTRATSQGFSRAAAVIHGHDRQGTRHDADRGRSDRPSPIFQALDIPARTPVRVGKLGVAAAPDAVASLICEGRFQAGRWESAHGPFIVVSSTRIRFLQLPMAPADGGLPRWVRRPGC